MAHERLLIHVMDVYPSGSKPDFSMIKKRIDALIDREYIERINIEHRPAYRYIV
jgi:cullin 3